MSPGPSWPFRPTPANDEILSSYLARIAYAHGLPPYRFFSFFFPGVPIWNRDIDRSASDQLIDGVATRCGVSFEQVCSMTLRAYEASFRYINPLRKQANPGISRCINAAGIFHRNRKRHGMQYCPECLVENMAFKRAWRLSFVTACSIHNCSLQDCCPRCGHPVIFHRSDSFHPNCHSCGGFLTTYSAATHPVKRLDERIRLQAFLLGIIESGKVRILDRCVSSPDFFLGLMALFQIVRSKMRSKNRSCSVSELYANCPTAQMELLRIDDRARQSLILINLLENWPAQFFEFADAQKLTQATIQSRNKLPDWLNSVLSALPSGITRLRKAPSPFIRQKIQKLHRHKIGNWRAERAKLLLNAARIQS